MIMNNSVLGIPYTMRKSSRARYMRLAVYAGGELVVTAPTRVSLFAVEEFIAKKADWILRTTLRMSKIKKPLLSRGSKKVAYFSWHVSFNKAITSSTRRTKTRSSANSKNKCNEGNRRRTR